MDLLFPFFALVALLAAAIAVLAALKERGSSGRLLFSLGLAVLSAECLFSAMLVRSSLPNQTVFWEIWRFLPKSLIPGLWLLFTYRFARAHQDALRPGPLILVAFVVVVPLASVFLFQDSLLILAGSHPGNPFRIGWSGYALYTTLLIASASILINLEKTFRASVGVYRWRIKFIILGVATIFTARIYTASQTLLMQKDLVSFDIIDTTAVFIACCFFLAGVLRPASFNVELYPSEKVLRISITTILLGVYLLVIGLFSEALGHWDSPSAFALKALGLLLSLAMIAIFLLSERSRDRFRRFVSRHFHRPMYDYRLAWLTFNEKTASLSSAESLGTALVNWVSEELKILSATIWLIDYDKEQFTLLASTGLLNLPASQSGDNSRFKSVLQILQASSMPFDIDLQKDAGPPLGVYFPGYFKKGGNRVCVPISTKGKPLAFLTLGDRVNGISFAQEEFDLLKCVADQSASILLNLELANRLLQAKEMEAFQTISAFFVHDLKNTASTLNLTLQNLPKHFDNPEFRKDALKSISKSVSHLQNLISRLTLFRQKLELTTIETDLNSILQSTLSSIGPNFEVQTEFAASMPICADREQLQKVFTNLILNAREASNDNSRINVTTYQQNGYSIATVSDNGCGMSSEFITRSLFRPFKTTKKGGIGIGMFQSKAIIDAHQGKIEVESQPGRGTTFRVLIPAKR